MREGVKRPPQPPAKARRPYVRPAFASSDAFERFAAACTGLTPSGPQPKFTGCTSPQAAS
jgi:hypothetical protein